MDVLPYQADRAGDAWVVTFRPSIVDRVYLERVNYELHGLLEEQDRPRVVLDLSQLDAISSAILGLIMGVDLKVLRREGELRLCGLSAQVSEVFHLMKLDRVLTIHPNVRDAIASFEGIGDD